MALAQYNASVLSFGSFHAMHEPGCWCNAGVCTGHMATAAPFPEAGKRAQNKHVQMRVSMFVWMARVAGEGTGVGDWTKNNYIYIYICVCVCVCVCIYIYI